LKSPAQVFLRDFVNGYIYNNNNNNNNNLLIAGGGGSNNIFLKFLLTKSGEKTHTFSYFST